MENNFFLYNMFITFFFEFSKFFFKLPHLFSPIILFLHQLLLFFLQSNQLPLVFFIKLFPLRLSPQLFQPFSPPSNSFNFTSAFLYSSTFNEIKKDKDIAPVVILICTKKDLGRKLITNLKSLVSINCYWLVWQR